MPQDVTDAELAVLQTLWEQGETTIRQLTAALYPQGTPAQYATVQKLLDRLEAKGCVARDRSSWPHTFTATLDLDELIGRRLRAVAEQLCGGSLTPLLSHLLKIESWGPGEREELQGYLEELDEKLRPKGKR